jgi:hypothetical protein
MGHLGGENRGSQLQQAKFRNSIEMSGVNERWDALTDYLSEDNLKQLSLA